jgi:hypothetical protein
MGHRHYLSGNYTMLVLFAIRQLVNFWSLSLKKLYSQINFNKFKAMSAKQELNIKKTIAVIGQRNRPVNWALCHNGALRGFIWCSLIHIGAIKPPGLGFYYFSAFSEINNSFIPAAMRLLAGEWHDACSRPIRKLCRFCE